MKSAILWVCSKASSEHLNTSFRQDEASREDFLRSSLCLPPLLFSLVKQDKTEIINIGVKRSNTANLFFLFCFASE